MKKLVTLVLALGVFSLSAQNDRTENKQSKNNNQNFTTWDGDQDGYINDDEFDRGWDQQDYYTQWDADRDGKLNKEEWTRGTNQHYSKVDGWQKNENRNYSTWDQDGDGMLSEDEFKSGSYATWDEDGDGRVSTDEYNMYNGTSNRSNTKMKTNKK